MLPGAGGKSGLGRCAMVSNWCLDFREKIYPCTYSLPVNGLVLLLFLCIYFEDHRFSSKIDAFLISAHVDFSIGINKINTYILVFYSISVAL